MPIPDSPRVIYKNNPLSEVICQLRFPSILRIGVNDPVDYQDAIKDCYPIYLKETPQVSLPPLLAGMPSLANLQLQTDPTHKFFTMDMNRSISLTKDFLALVDLKYTEWTSLKDEIMRANEVLQDIYKPPFYTRVGLRYVDVIKQTIGGNTYKWDELLMPFISGIKGDSEVSDDVKACQMVTDMSIKLSESCDAQIRLITGMGKNRENEDCFIIDADFFIEQQRGVGNVFEILNQFNREAGKLFRWAISDRLHELLGPNE